MGTFVRRLGPRYLLLVVVLGLWLSLDTRVLDGALPVGEELNTGFADTTAVGIWYVGVKAYIDTRNPTVSEHGISECSTGMDDTLNIGVRMGYAKNEGAQAPDGVIKWVDKNGAVSFFAGLFAPTVDHTHCYQVLREKDLFGVWCYVFRFDNTAMKDASETGEFGNFKFCRAMYGGSTKKQEDHVPGYQKPGSPPGPNKLCHLSCHVWVSTRNDWEGAATWAALGNPHPNGAVRKIGPGSFDIWDTRGE